MKTQKVMRSFFSGDFNLDINLPCSWKDLTQKELYKVLSILKNRTVGHWQSLVLLFFLLSGLRVKKYTNQGVIVKKGFVRRHLLSIDDVHFACEKLNFLLEDPTYVVHLKKIKSFSAIDELLRNVPFVVYLTVDNYYNSFLRTQDPECLKSIAGLLYESKKTRKMKFNEVELFSVFFWWYSLKLNYKKRFSYLFIESPVTDDTQSYNAESNINAMIRSLTGADVTKEKEILDFDTYRALTELNEKAREAEEFNRKIKK